MKIDESNIIDTMWAVYAKAVYSDKGPEDMILINARLGFVAGVRSIRTMMETAASEGLDRGQICAIDAAILSGLEDFARRFADVVSLHDEAGIPEEM